MNYENGSYSLTYTCPQCGRIIKTNGPAPSDSICSWCQIPAATRQAIAEQMKQDTVKNINWNKK